MVRIDKIHKNYSINEWKMQDSTSLKADLENIHPNPHQLHINIDKKRQKSSKKSKYFCMLYIRHAHTPKKKNDENRRDEKWEVSESPRIYQFQVHLNAFSFANMCIWCAVWKDTKIFIFINFYLRIKGMKIILCLLRNDFYMEMI